MDSKPFDTLKAYMQLADQLAEHAPKNSLQSAISRSAGVGQAR
jgi:hypothetical protein